jgi:filamentous hemagglutinin
VTGLDQQGGELFSNTALSLDLNNGQLNNQGGLINAPGTLLLTNLKGVDNQNGEISSEQSFDLSAESLDNSGGKLLSSQTLTLVVDKALRNLKGTISAAVLSSESDSLDNSEGLISSRGALDLTVDKALSNVQGTVIADGDLELNAATVNNTKGQIASKQNLIAHVDNLEQLAGELVAQGALTLTGDTLVNGENGFVGATQGINLIVSDIDNRGSEISSQGAISLTAQQLNNSDGGRVLAQQALTLNTAEIVNGAGVLSSSKAGLTLTGASVDNTGGSVSALQGLTVDLSGVLDNSRGLISSEGLLTVGAGSLTNTVGSVSSAGDLKLDVTGAIGNDGGALVTDGALDLHSASLTNRQSGNISGKRLLTLTTGDFDNSQKGRVSGGDRLQLTAAKLNNREGSIGSSQALVASVTALDQQGGRLFSNTSLSLDLNNGELNNQGGLINAPGTLLLKNLGTVLNQNGEISSAEAFELNARTLENGGGKLLSNQNLTLRIAQALNSVKGTIAAAGVDIEADTLNNSGGTLISRSDLDLTITGLVNNRDQGLINSAGTLDITAASLDAGNDGEVSALGDMTLALNALSLNAGRLIGDAAVSIDLNSGDLSNQAGLITAKGALTLERLRDLYNQGGEISSDQSFLLSGRMLNNSKGKIISSNLLTLLADSLNNQTGLLSGWEGVTATGGSLDNRNTGTVSSRHGNVGVNLSGALLNGNAGALVSQKALTVTANSLDNTGGILSSGAGQTLTVSGLLNNSQNGLIDSGAGLAVKADTLQNVAGNIAAQQDVNVEARELNNTSGSLSSKGSMTLDLLGQLVNTQGKLASGGAMLLRRSTQINNQGGQLVSQSLMTLNTASLDNSNRGTVAANGSLVLNATGKVFNNADGLIYSQNADLQLTAATLDNARGAVQGQTGLNLDVTGDIDNLNGRLIAQTGALDVEAANLDSRGGVLSSLQGAFTATVTGVLRNGYDLTNKGGVIQAQRLSLLALGGFDNNGGRISARTGEALITTANFDNRNGGLYGKGLLRVIARDFDNSANGQIAAGQIDLRLSGALSNQTGIVESDSTLSVAATRIDNQSGRLRVLGAGGKTDFQIGSLFDNRNGALDVANSDLTLNTPSFLNTGGSLLHTGSGTFDISTGNITNAGGSVVTQGGLTLTADSWTNNSVIQAGRLTVNVGTLHQTASGQLLASSAFTGKGGNWTNDGVIASDGSTNLVLSGRYNGAGQISGVGAVGVTAAQLELGATSAIRAGGNSDINISGLLTNNGNLSSNATMTVNASQLDNFGMLSAGQNLIVKTPALRNERGLMFSGQNMSLLVGDLTNQNASIYGFGNLDISGWQGGSANSVNNLASSINVDGDFTLAAATFLNKTEAVLGEERLVSGDITYACQGGRECKWVDYHIEEHWESESKIIGDQAIVSVGGNLTARAGDFSNYASVISAGKNVRLDVGTFDNTALESGNFTKSLIYNARVYGLEDLVDEQRGAMAAYNRRNSKYIHRYMDGSKKLSRTEQITSQLNPDFGIGPEVAAPEKIFTYDYKGGDTVFTGTGGTPSIVQAGGTLAVNATGTVKNGTLQANAVISGIAKNAPGTRVEHDVVVPYVHLNAQLPPDLAQQQVNPLVLPGFSLPTGQNGLFRLSSQTTSNTSAADTSPQSWSLGSGAVSVAQREHAVPAASAGTIELGSIGQISGATRQLSLTTRQNAGITANASQFETSLPTGTPTGGVAVPGHSSDAASFAGTDAVTGVTTTHQANGAVPPVQNAGSSGTVPFVNPDASNSGTDLVSGSQTVGRVQGLPSSGFVSKPQKYLIETNPVLTNLKQFMSSDYLLSKLGYDPDASAKRLGDGLYEQRLVQQAVVARTGQAFLGGQTSNEDQFRYLMNNAITSKDQLNLAVGVSLTSQQVAALTHDIVWLEEHEVNGEKVLVPVLYLAQANNRLGPTGALLAGNDVTVIAGENLENVGTIKASNSLSVTAGNDIVNSGLLEAGNRLDLLAGNDVVNKSGGIIAGRDVSVMAVGGDVINERSVTTAMNTSGRAVGRTDYADTAARIEAGNDMALSAGRDVNVIGGVLQSGRDTALDAGRDVNLLSAETVSSDRRTTIVTQLSADVASGRDLKINAARDVNAIASQISAKRDIAASANQNLTISSAADEYHYLSKSKKVTVQKDDIRQVSTDMTAGGDISLNAGQDLAIIASRITATGKIGLDAAQDMTISSAKDESSYFYAKKSKGSFGRSSSKQQESYDSTNVASEITAGGDLTVNASKAADGGISINGGRDVSIIGSHLTAGDDLVLSATNDVAVLSGVEEHGAYSKKTKSGFMGISNSGKSNLKTSATQVASGLQAGNDVVVASGKDIRLRASEIGAGNDVELRAGLVDSDGDLNLVSANDQAYSHSEQYKKKTGLSVSGGFLSVSSAKEAGREAQSSTSVGSQVNATRDAALEAQRDVNVSGSSVNAGRNVSLNAGRDVNVLAAENAQSDRSWEKNRQSGIGISSDANGVTFFAGIERETGIDRLEQQTAAASRISAGENLAVNAKRDINQVGSDLEAANDLNLTAGRNIKIDAARETLLQEQIREKERNGLSLSMNHNYGRTKDAVSGAGKGDDNVSKGSSTLKAIDSVSQFTSGATFDGKDGNSKQSATEQIVEQNNRASTLHAGNDVNISSGNDVLISGSELRAGRDINVSGRNVTLDAAKNQSIQETRERQSWSGIHGGTSGGIKVGVGGSNGVASGDSSQQSSTATALQAGRDVNLEARNDLSLIGTQVQATRDIDVKAGNDLYIKAAQNNSATENTRKNGGGEVGLTFGSEGVGVYASVNIGKGDLDRKAEQQQEAYLYAGNRLGFSSGQDTNIAGASLRGDQVVGRVGRDLNVTSLPDTGKVKGSEFDLSATVAIGLGVSASGSVGFGRTDGSTNWIEQQTTITGKSAVDIRTEKHTQLDGAVIASDNGNLKLDTGSLGFSDIAGNDKEHGYYLNVGGTYGQKPVQDASQTGKGGKDENGWSVEGWNYEKDRQQIVRATVGAGDIVVRDDAATGVDSTSGLNRDVAKAYEITRDEEHRTDLYVSESSLKAVANPKATLKQWQDNVERYGENSEQAIEKLVDAFLVTTYLASQGGSAGAIDIANKYLVSKEIRRVLSSKDESTRAEVVKQLLSRITGKPASSDLAALADRITSIAGQDSDNAYQALTLISTLNERKDDGAQDFVAVIPAAAAAAGALAVALTANSSTPEGQERLKAAANAVATSAAHSGQTLQEQVATSVEIWKFLFNTTFPIHLLDDENRKLVNPIVEAQGANPASGGYAAGTQPSVPAYAGGREIAEQQENDYSRPVTDLPEPGIMNQDSVTSMKDFFLNTEFGKNLNGVTKKTSKLYQGQSVYQAQENLGGYIRKGDQIYLDGLHKDHLEVFDKRNQAKYVLNLDGSVNLEKTKKAAGRSIK